MKAVCPSTLAPWLSHWSGCPANDLDPLDHAPCTCGLRQHYDPWNRLGRPAESPALEESDPAPEPDYRQRQADLRAAGWTPDNSDYVDEFPQW